MQSAALRASAALFLTLIAAMALANWTSEPPAPRRVNAPDQFVLANAQRDLAEIARAPHVAGTAEHARVRAFLAERLLALGLEVELQNDFGVRQSERFGGISASPVDNVIAILPGKDRAAPALALMAHYDSGQFSPAAGDDGSGTVALLETARQLAAGPKPVRDVVFLITDAEELGLIGAHSFFTRHPLARRIGAVVNAEARGSRGRATMFQTSPGNAELVSLWARNAISPSGNSLTDAVYRALPNDTDLTISLDAGKIGINAAFVDGQFDYHMPTDSIASLSPATLQHLGDFALTTTRALAMAPALPSTKADSSFFDLFGLTVVRYPHWAGWLLVALGLGGFAVVALSPSSSGEGLLQRETSPLRLAKNGAGIIGMTALVGALCHFLPGWLYAHDAISGHEMLAEMSGLFWLCLSLCAGIAALARPTVAAWVAAILLLLLLGLAAQIWLPGGSWLFLWPGLVGLAILNVARRFGLIAPVTLFTTAVAGGLFFALIFQMIWMAHISIGALTPALIALLIPYTLALFGPLILWQREAVPNRHGAYGLLGTAVLATLFLTLHNGFDRRHPKPGDLFHLTEASTGSTWWATTSARNELPEGKAERFAAKGLPKSAMWRIPAPAAGAPQPRIMMTKQGQRVRLEAQTSDAPRTFALVVEPEAAMPNATLNGRPVTFKPDNRTRIAYRAQQPARLILEWDAGKGGVATISWLHATDGLPAGAPKPNGPPTDWTWLSESRTVVGSEVMRW